MRGKVAALFCLAGEATQDMCNTYIIILTCHGTYEKQIVDSNIESDTFKSFLLIDFIGLYW